MRRNAICLLAILAIAAPGLAQPCGLGPAPMLPLIPGPNPGDTTGLPAGCGGACPWTPPVPCSFYGTNLSPEVWYMLVLPPGLCGTMTLTTCAGLDPAAFAAFDTSIAVWSGACPGPFAFVACNGDGPGGGGPPCPGFTSDLSFPVAGGIPYWIKLNGFTAADFGPYAMVAILTPGPCPFTLALSGGAGALSVDVTGGPPGIDYFTAASFDAANFGPLAGAGWWFGLHIALNDLVTEHQLAIPPFRGVLDGSGAATFTLSYPPVMAGLMVAAVTIVDGAGTPFASTPVDTFTF